MASHSDSLLVAIPDQFKLSGYKMKAITISTRHDAVHGQQQ